MTHAQIVGLGVRLFAVWLAVYLMRHVPGLWSFNVRDFEDPGAATAVIVVAVVMALIALLLWIFPLSVARKLVPKTALDQPTTLPVEQVQSVGFALLGLWVLTRAIPQVFFYAVMIYHANRPQSAFALEPRNYASMAYTFVELALGIWLVLGAKGLRGVLRWARTAGTSE